MNELRSVLRNGLALAGRAWIEMGLRAIYTLVIARFLGPADYGLWSYVMTAYMLGVSAAALGMDLLVSARLGRDRIGATAMVETSLALRLILLSVAALGLVLVALAAGHEPQVAIAMGLALLAVFGRGLATWSRALFQGLERGDIALSVTFACRLGEVVLGIIVLLATRNVLLLVALHSASWLAEAAITMVRARRLAGFGLPRLHREETMPLLRAAFPTGAAMACNAVLLAAPVLMASAFGASRDEVGQMGIATQLATLAVMAAQGFLSAAVPVLARAVARGDSRTPHYGAMVAGVVVLVFGLLAGMAHVLGEPVITWVLGDQFAVGARLLPLALAVGGANLLANGLWHEQVLRDRQRPGVLGGLTGLAVLAVVAHPLWNAHGLEGLLLATGISWLARSLVLFVLARQNPT